MKLKISKELSLPEDAVTQKAAWIGRTGSGKSYGAMKLCELLLDAKKQVIILDPVGIWYGLKVKGAGDAYSIPIFGGEHADIPLPHDSGETIATLIVEKNLCAILDVSEMRKNQRKQFVTDFGEQFFHLKKKNRSQVHFFIEEAQVFVPQRVMKGEERMLGTMEDICKLGRNYGIGVSLISQRPQSVHKDCLNQTEALFAFQINGPQERKALSDWVVDKGLEKSTVSEDLAGLAVGDCFLWSPQWLRILQKIHIDKKQTADTSSTPTGKSHNVAVQQLDAAQLQAIKSQLTDVLEKVKENDPKELQAKFRNLQKQYDALKKLSEQPGKTTAVPAVDYTQINRTIDALTKIMGLFNVHKNNTGSVEGIIENMAAHVGFVRDAITEEIQRLKNLLPSATQKKVHIHIPVPSRAEFQHGINKSKAINNGSTPSTSTLPEGERAILNYCAMFDTGAGRAQLTTLTGYKRSTRDAYLQRLTTKGYVEKAGDKIKATEAGIEALGNSFQQLPIGEDLQQFWLGRLPEGEAKIFKLLIDAGRVAISRDEISEKTGYQRSTRDAYLQRMSAKHLVTTSGRGHVQANANLFD